MSGEACHAGDGLEAQFMITGNQTPLGGVWSPGVGERGERQEGEVG